MAEENKNNSIDPTDVSKWTEEYFNRKLEDKMKSMYGKLDSIRLLMRNGQQWVAGEQLVGIMDQMKTMIFLMSERKKQ